MYSISAISHWQPLSDLVRNNAAAREAHAFATKLRVNGNAAYSKQLHLKLEAWDQCKIIPLADYHYVVVDVN